MKQISLLWITLLFILTTLSVVQAGTYNYISIDYPGAETVEARGVNDVGQIVGNYHDGITSRGFSLTGSNYTSINYPGSWSTQVTGVNDVGQIVGYYVDPTIGEYRGFSLTGSNYTSINYPGSWFTQVYGVNDAARFGIQLWRCFYSLRINICNPSRLSWRRRNRIQRHKRCWAACWLLLG